MFEIVAIAVFCWLFYKVLRLSLKIAWGTTKVIAIVLFVLSIPVLIGCLILASGAVLMLPVAMVVVAWGTLKMSS